MTRYHGDGLCIHANGHMFENMNLELLLPLLVELGVSFKFFTLSTFNIFLCWVNYNIKRNLPQGVASFSFVVKSKLFLLLSTKISLLDCPFYNDHHFDLKFNL